MAIDSRAVKNAKARAKYHLDMQDDSKRAAHRERVRKAANRAYWKSDERRADYIAAQVDYKQRKRAEDRELFNLRSKLSTYKLTLDQYHARLESQDFLCAICQQERPLQIDHHHDSRKPRGLLCRACNTAFWIFDQPDVLSRAEAYRRKWA